MKITIPALKNKFIFFLVFLCSISFSTQAAAFTLEQKFAYAQAGEFIVTSQENNYSLLFIRSITSDILLLEEISVPTHQIDLKKINWKNWAYNKAPGHTSWTLYEIDRKNGKLIECFSYSKNGWLYLDQSEQFLTQLLTLPLIPVPDKERKKIGPQPPNHEEDHRAIWNPPLIVEGKKNDKHYFNVWKAQWPNDTSRLSHCRIELYFIEDFPFPFWFEVQSPHYTFKMRAIDSGHNVFSPMTGPMPHRVPHILRLTQRGDDKYRLWIKTPDYFQKLHLFVIDLTGESKVMTAIPFSAQNGPNKEELIVEIATADLNKILQNKHRYRWVLIPEANSAIYVESEEIFTWNG